MAIVDHFGSVALFSQTIVKLELKLCEYHSKHILISLIGMELEELKT